ncbi:MAG: HIT domain-containing protein [Thermoprotei archaeon]
MNECIFCKIVQGEIPSKRLFESADFIAVNDVSPVAPTHVLLISKLHVANILEAAGLQRRLPFLETVYSVAKQLSLEKRGFRLVVNTGEQGGQTVNHFHAHIIAGRQMAWPPG